MLKNSIRLLSKTQRSQNLSASLVLLQQQANKQQRVYSTVGNMDKFDLPKRLQGSAPSVW